MTISSAVRIAGPFTGDGINVTFPFTYKVFSAADVQVIRLTISTGVETTLTIVTDYNITLNGNQNSNPGGSIVLTTPLLALYTLTATSNIANLQPTDLTNQGGFYPEVITDALDRATIQIQQMSDDVTRSIKSPLSDDLTTMDMTLPVVADRINKLLAFGATGMPTTVAQSPSSITGNTSIVGTLGVTGATTLQSTLGVAGTLGVTGATTLSSVGVTGAATVGTTLGVTGATTLVSVGVTGAATVGTTLGVTGATTLASVGVTNAATVGTTLGVSGDFAVNTNKFTVTASSGNTLAAGTFTATGGVVAASLTSKIQQITATVASNALTVTLSPTILDFRSTTLGSGVITTVVVSSTITIVCPSTATLGTTNAVQSRIAVIAIKNGSSAELGLVNMSGGSELDETGLISTTAIAAASNSATLYYSTAARSSVAYRLVGYVESTQATAGTWATAPSTIQGVGGQAFNNMSSIGYGQTFQSFTASRVSGTTYYNTTGKPIFVTIEYNSTLAPLLNIGGTTATLVALNTTENISFLVPAYMSYSFTAASGINDWYEVR